MLSILPKNNDLPELEMIARCTNILSIVLFFVLTSNVSTAQITSVNDALTPASLNVFRRHQAPSEDMFNYYGKVLGFAQHAIYDVGNAGVANFRVGESMLKLTYQEAEWEYLKGDLGEITGLTLLTFFFPSENELHTRFVEHSLIPPTFQKVSGRTFAVVQDPDGQWVELVIAPNQPDSFYAQIEAGLIVSDLDKSREFYRNFIGLEELTPSADHLLPTIRYQFRRGNVTLTLRQMGENLPADTGSGGIQYSVTDAHAVEALAVERSVQIDKPTYVLESFNMNFLWLADPDGIINYFAQTEAE